VRRGAPCSRPDLEHRKRHLLRLWLNVENGLPVDPEAFPYRYGVPVGQADSAAHNAR
jgi:hypothetical protein